MGGQTGSTLQGNNSQLSQLFGNGYQQPNQVTPITQPQAQTQLLPTPEQAAAATQARMLARSPMAAPTTAPQQQNVLLYTRHSGEPVYGPPPKSKNQMAASSATKFGG